MLEIHASAPGKLILHGEHAVVHGKLAVAASLGLRASLTLKSNESDRVELTLSELDINISFPLNQLPQLPECGVANAELDTALHDPIHELVLARQELQEGLESRRLAVEALLYLYCGIIQASQSQTSQTAKQGVSIVVQSQLPIGAGLGSSAAYSVCLASAMLAATRPVDQSSEKDLEVINKWAFLSETIIHGKPSGLDNTISCFGGAVSFASGNFSRVSTFQSLQVVLVDTGVPRSTKALVAGVKDRKDQFPGVMNPLLESIGALSQTFLDISQQLAESEADSASLYHNLETLMDMNHSMLNAIGVGHPALDEVVQLSRSQGFAAKLTGAGGGGCAFVLLRPDTSEDTKSALFKALQERGLRYWVTSLGGQGAAVERVSAQ